MSLQLFKNHIITGKIIFNKRLSLILWFGLSVIAALFTIGKGEINNFLVFKYVYIHLLQKTNLYLTYPGVYEDVNLYGPAFSLLIAPFALLPVKAGAFLWVLFNTFFLYVAFTQLPLKNKYITALVFLCSHEMMTCSSWLQSNGIIAGCIILGFCYTLKQKEWLALFFIMFATFIKLYGIVGFAFIFFSKQPLRFILWALLWSLFFFLAPLLFTNFTFLIQSYKDWYEGLSLKAAKNIRLDTNYFYQDISLMGLIRRILYPALNDAFVIIPGIILMASQFIYYKYYKDIRYQLFIFCSVLIFAVIFSTGSESPTYIIALPAICIWYFLQPNKKQLLWFFIFLLILTTFSYSDIVTPWVREHIVKRYSLKALPASIVWMIILIQIHSKKFLNADKIYLRRYTTS